VQTAPKIDGTLNDPAWKTAARVQLDWDFTFRRSADERTDAYLLVDTRYLYVAFVAKQHEPITATQHTNDQGLSSDDAVTIYLWPTGNAGIEYGFEANPAGTRYAFSTENTAFAPSWEAAATTLPGEYIVTERIPLGVMRGDGRATWRIQFARTIRAANQTLEWAHNLAQGNPDTSLYAGYVGGMSVAARNTRTKPRVAVYGLGEYGSPTSGLSTSRAGADIALPITPTASFVGTFHPDYSNVELDQQSISPTAFQRRYQEVRPFFTQGANYYNDMNCNDCLNWPLLYTPAIPTPRDGYAIEGTQGTFTFGGFDAVGNGRTDIAQSVRWRTPDQHDSVMYQSVNVDIPGLQDRATYVQGVVGNAHNFSTYVTLGDESGSLVPDVGEGRYREYGVNLYTPKSGIFAAWHDVGSEYAPLDAFNQVNDVRGPSIYFYRVYDNSPHSFIQSIEPSIDYARFVDSKGDENYAYDSLYLSFMTRNQWSLLLTTGSQYLRFPNTPGGLTNQNGFVLSYGSNTSAPSSFTYNVGRFGAGDLQSTDLQTAVRVRRFGTLSLEAYHTDDLLDTGARLQQWLERVSFAYQIGPRQSIALGWRRIIGTGPTFFTPPQFIDATNFSLAYYRRFHDAELYFAYGTPNQLNTQHDLLLKLIRYIGAEKGT
jgi:hypothetical protein